MADPTAVRVGPGKLYFAPLSSTEPTDLTTAWAAAWVPVGYTEEGHSFTQTPSFDPIEVAEEKIPIRYEQGNVEMQVEFAVAEITAANIQKAFNGGTITTGTGLVTFEPPAPDTAPIRVAIGWEANDGSERWVWRRCLQTGASAMERRKAPAKTTIPMTFQLEKPTGVQPFKAIFKTAAA